MSNEMAQSRQRGGKKWIWLINLSWKIRGYNTCDTSKQRGDFSLKQDLIWELCVLERSLITSLPSSVITYVLPKLAINLKYKMKSCLLKTLSLSGTMHHPYILSVSLSIPILVLSLTYLPFIVGSQDSCLSFFCYIYTRLIPSVVFTYSFVWTNLYL